MRSVGLANRSLRTSPKFTSSIRVFDQIRDQEIPITLRPSPLLILSYLLKSLNAQKYYGKLAKLPIKTNLEKLYSICNFLNTVSYKTSWIEVGLVKGMVSWVRLCKFVFRFVLCKWKDPYWPGWQSGVSLLVLKIEFYTQ